MRGVSLKCSINVANKWPQLLNLPHCLLSACHFIFEEEKR